MSKNKPNKPQSQPNRLSKSDPKSTADVADLKSRVKELTDENRRLRSDYENQLELAKREYDDLNQFHQALLGAIEKADKAAGSIRYPVERRFVRGKLPGEKLIKVDCVTGKFTEITRDEWNLLPR